MSPEYLLPSSKYKIYESQCHRPQTLFLSLCHTVLQALERKEMDHAKWLPVDIEDRLFFWTLCVTMARLLLGLSLVNGDDSLLLCH